MLIDGGADETVETSSLEASNLIVLRVSALFITYSVIILISMHGLFIYSLFDRTHLLSIQMQTWEFMVKVY